MIVLVALAVAQDECVVLVVAAVALASFGTAEFALSCFTAFCQAVAEGVSDSFALSAFYCDRDYALIWIGAEDVTWRSALLTALSCAAEYGLLFVRYEV